MRDCQNKPMAAAWRRSKMHRGKADVWVGLESMVAGFGGTARRITDKFVFSDL